MSGIQVMVGDCRDVLRTLPDRSVQCCVTSPPYWGLRDYGHAGQIGQEPTPEAFVATLVEVFREVRRVLKDDGTCWVNLGDTYASQRGGTYQPAETLAGGRHGKTVDGEKVNRGRLDGYCPARNASAIGMKHKDLIGIPWMVAFALRADGWYLRQDIIWAKPNPMPESVTDRCTKSHEYIFLLSKAARYYYDHEAVKEVATNRPPGNTKPTKGGREYDVANGEHHRTASNLHQIGAVENRNKRSVWTVPTAPYKEAHFATYPPDLIKPCILAGTRPGDMVLDPFGGSGTTGQVALEFGRRAVLIELNPEYAQIIDRRTDVTPGLGLE